jgi:hypothetical protein
MDDANQYQLLHDIGQKLMLTEPFLNLLSICQVEKAEKRFTS